MSILCIDNLAILALLSGYLISYNTETRCEIWKLKLNDSILHITLSQNYNNSLTKLYCGLSDGTIAVVEFDANSKEPRDVFYVPLSKSPITYIEIVNDKLWCASANLVYILNEK